jgi:hypothetical protein
MDNPNAKFKIYTISKLVAEGEMEEDGTINLEKLKKLKKGTTYLIHVEGEGTTYLIN